MRKGDQGFVLVASLLFAMVLIAFVASIIGSGVALRQQSRYRVATQVAHQAAESGVHMAVSLLAGPNKTSFLAAGSTEGVMAGTGERAAQYRVILTPAGSDGADNDLDGAVDEADENDMIEVTSRGDFDGVARTVRVTLLARYAMPTVPGAAYFANPLADLNFNGNTFLVSGHDVDLNGNPTGVVSPGIGVNGNPAGLISQIQNQQTDNVIGSGGTPSVVQVPPIDIQALVEEGARSANINLESGGTHQPSEPGEWGTVSAPAIVYGNGDIKISGGAVGAGVLIVNGTLEISGAFDWRGIIIVQGGVLFKGGGDDKLLVGALVVQDSIVQEAGPGGLNAAGTVDIILSEQMVQRMTEAFDSYTVLNWREGPNPPEEALP